MDPGQEGASRGFAANPGPWCPAGARLRVLSANVTSASSLPGLASALSSPFVVAAQEPRITVGVAEGVQAGLRAQQVVGLWPQGDSPLVAAFVRQVAARTFDVPVAERLSMRIARFTIFRARAPIHLFNVYSTVGGSQAAANHCVSLVTAALQAASEIGHQPCFLLGDFNQDPLPPQASALLAVAGWVGLAEGLGLTTAPGFGRLGRRIDRG